MASRSKSKTDSEWRFRGLGKVRTAECGCEVISYPFGKTIWSGCWKHRPHNEYVCQVCFKTFKTDKALSVHRWEHSE